MIPLVAVTSSLLAAAGCSKSFIVVGSGAGGAPMAYKLAKAGCQVTLLEKGPDHDWQGESLPMDSKGTTLPMDLFSPEYSYIEEMLAAPSDIQTVHWTEPVW